MCCGWSFFCDDKTADQYNQVIFRDKLIVLKVTKDSDSDTRFVVRISKRVIECASSTGVCCNQSNHEHAHKGVYIWEPRMFFNLHFVRLQTQD